MSLLSSVDVITLSQFNQEILTRKIRCQSTVTQKSDITSIPDSEAILSSEESELERGSGLSLPQSDTDSQDSIPSPRTPSPVPDPEPLQSNPTNNRPLIQLPILVDGDPSRPSHVSILAEKYLLFANNGANNKDLQKCINVETREQFFCKTLPRNTAGVSLLATYHRLDEFKDCIGSVHEVILAPKKIYLIFPTNYGSVHSYILAKKRVSETEAANLFKQIVTAVGYCHEKGIVLRDLKMGKFVFFDKERTVVKLESLEDSVLLHDLTDDGLSDKHGCPNYVSPEKADILRSNSKYPGKATDVWGLGVILYTMLVGRYPFNDSDHSKLFVKIRKGNFSLPESLSSSVKCLIRCLLRKEPSERLTCQEILKHPWIRNQGSPSTPNELRRYMTPSNLTSSRDRLVAARSSSGVVQSPQSQIRIIDRMESDDQVVPDFVFRK